MAEPTLGIDIGRVIIGGGEPGGGDTSFFDGSVDEAMRTPAVEGAFDAIARLTERFDGRVWLVSKCGPRTEERTRQWLDHHDFHGRTAVPADHVRFCRERAQKAGHCEELGVTHFVDDKAEVLGYLRGLVPHLFLFGPQDAPPPAWTVAVETWSAAEIAVLASIGHGHSDRTDS